VSESLFITRTPPMPLIFKSHYAVYIHNWRTSYTSTLTSHLIFQGDLNYRFCSSFQSRFKPMQANTISHVPVTSCYVYIHERTVLHTNNKTRSSNRTLSDTVDAWRSTSNGPTG